MIREFIHLECVRDGKYWYCGEENGWRTIGRSRTRFGMWLIILSQAFFFWSEYNYGVKVVWRKKEK